MYKISIISPVYNVEKYIVSCIDSILSQTLDEIEVIFVDDHGIDESIKKAKDYLTEQNTKKTFRFIETPSNSGPGIARNIGVKLAQGEYVAFIDSDDWIEPTFCEELYTTAKIYDCDLCCCQALKDFEDGRKSVLLKNPDIDNGILIEKNRKKFLTRFVAYHWTFLFKKEFLQTNKIQYPKERSSEDSFFITMSVLWAKNMAKINSPLYHYISRNTSISNYKNEFRYRDKLSVFSQMLGWTKDAGLYLNYKAEIDFIYLKKGFFVSVFDYITNSLNPEVAIISEIYNELIVQIPDYQNNLYYRKKIMFRILSLLIKYAPSLAVKLIKRILAVKANWG